MVGLEQHTQRHRGRARTRLACVRCGLGVAALDSAARALARAVIAADTWVNAWRFLARALDAARRALMCGFYSAPAAQTRAALDGVIIHALNVADMHPATPSHRYEVVKSLAANSGSGPPYPH